MDLQQVYVKTSKGQTEVQKRIYKLPASLRKVLIMVDGHSTAGQMLERLSSMGDISGALAELESSGFIAGSLPVDGSVSATQTISAMESADDPKSERMLLQNIWEVGDDAAHIAAAEPRVKSAEAQFKLEKAKSFVRSTLLAALGSAAARRVDRVEATTSVEELRLELDGIREMLPTVLSKRQAEQVWRQLEPLILPREPASVATAPTTKTSGNDLERLRDALRQILSKYISPNTEYWAERLMSAPSMEVLQIELDVFSAMLPRIFSRKQAAQVSEELAALLKTITLPNAEVFNLSKARDVVRYTLFAAMGPTAARRIERIDGISELGEFAKELEAIREMLPKVLSKRDAEQAWKQLMPVAESLNAALGQV